MNAIFFLSYCSLVFHSVSSTKPVNTGQRIFTDAQSIDFIDPSKHGFHIVLMEEFVSSHLQPVHAPTVYASAIALRHQTGHSHSSQLANRSMVHRSRSNGEHGLLRSTKTLYPENGSPEDGLLDGRTIKLLGLREKTWYYVCVEFESNLRRHELVTGSTCQLKRTLDKFGQSVHSTVNEIELIEVTDRSIAVGLTVNSDFPLRMHAYLDPDDADGSMGPSVPAQTFFVRPTVDHGRNHRLRVFFGPFLQSDTSYGRICLIEEPMVDIYTAMGRSVRTANEQCYLNDLKTKESTKMGVKRGQQDSPNSALAQVRSYHIGMMRGDCDARVANVAVLCTALVAKFLIPSRVI